jgi:heme/copper-type cytochrome/quinol oxidase subunit 2
MLYLKILRILAVVGIIVSTFMLIIGWGIIIATLLITFFIAISKLTDPKPTDPQLTHKFKLQVSVAAVMGGLGSFLELYVLGSYSNIKQSNGPETDFLIISLTVCVVATMATIIVINRLKLPDPVVVKAPATSKPKTKKSPAKKSASKKHKRR